MLFDDVELTADALVLLEQQHPPPTGREVDRCGQATQPAADDDDRFVHAILQIYDKVTK